MDTPTIQTVIVVAVQLIVGGILLQQIRTQKQIISEYKNLLDAKDPSKIIQLHDRQIEQIQNITSTDIDLLNKQVFELANYTAHMIYVWERSAKSIGEPNLFNETAFINLNMPHCSGVINKLREIRRNEGIE